MSKSRPLLGDQSHLLPRLNRQHSELDIVMAATRLCLATWPLDPQHRLAHLILDEELGVADAPLLLNLPNESSWRTDDLELLEITGAAAALAPEISA